MKLQKILCVLMCTITVLSCLAVGSTAADSDFVIEDGVLTKYNGNGGDIVIPDGVVEIGDQAFYSSETITSVVIPNGVTKIGYQAFSSSKNLKTVSIPDSVTDIGIAAFSYCTSLTEIIIPPKVAKIEDGTFHGDEALSKVTISEGVTAIGYQAFFACYGIESITLPESLEHIEDNAFMSCRGLKSITIPANVKTIGDGALLGYNITNISVSEENESFKSIDGVLFTKDGKKLLQYPTGIKNDEYTIPKGTTHIGNAAFRGCKNLLKVNIPEGVTNIGDGAFSYSEIPSITFPGTISNIGEDVFEYCIKLTDINVADENSFYKSIDGVLFSEDEKTIIRYPLNKAGTEYSIPDGVTKIEESAFNRCDSLNSITIPDSVTSIGVHAFDGTAYYNNASNWESGVLYEGVLYIGNFLICSSGEIDNPYTIKDGTVCIADYGLSLCRNMEKVIIPASLKSIGKNAFTGCSSLKNVTIPKGIVSIGESAFDGCTSLKEITLPDSLTYIGGYIFANCHDITVHCNEGTYAWQYAIDNGLIELPVTTTVTTTTVTTPAATTVTTPPETVAPPAVVPEITETEEVTIAPTVSETDALIVTTKVTEISIPETTETVAESTADTTTVISETVEITDTPADKAKPKSVIPDVLIAVLITGISVLVGCAVLYILDRRGIIELQSKKSPDPEQTEEEVHDDAESDEVLTENDSAEDNDKNDDSDISVE